MPLPFSDENDFLNPAEFAAEFAHDALRISGGSHGMWLGRALSLLCCLRQCAAADPGRPVSATFSECLSLDELHRRYLAGQMALHARASLGAYLNSLPGYNSAAFEARLADPANGKSFETTYEQHGYLSMQLIRVFFDCAEVFDNPALAARRDTLPELTQNFLSEHSIFTQEDYLRSFPCLARAIALSERIELREALTDSAFGDAGHGSGSGSKSL